jgi:hypothetical protein
MKYLFPTDCGIGLPIRFVLVDHFMEALLTETEERSKNQARGAAGVDLRLPRRSMPMLTSQHSQLSIAPGDRARQHVSMSPAIEIIDAAEMAARAES